MQLGFDIQNPGLIVVSPCEDCFTRQGDLLDRPEATGWGSQAEVVEEVTFDTGRDLHKRVLSTAKKAAKVDDSN